MFFYLIYFPSLKQFAQEYLDLLQTRTLSTYLLLKIIYLKKGKVPDKNFLSDTFSKNFVAFYLPASSIATATATDAPTIGLLPMPIRPIIST